MLEVRRLRLLLELERHGTIAGVAEALHFSPSGVSQQLALLEKEVGIPLLERVGRRVRLTEAAQLLTRHTDRVLRDLERAEAEVSSLAGQARGTLRIATFQTAALALVPLMLDRVQGRDGLRVELTEIEPEEALPALLARDFDMMIGEEYPGIPLPVSDEVHRQDLYADGVELALPDDAAAPDSGEVSIKDAAHCAWVMEPLGSRSRDWATALCRSAGFEPDVQFESADMLLHRELVRRGHAAALLPAILGKALPSALPTHSVDQVRQIFTVVRQGRQSHSAIRTVRVALASSAASLAGPPHEKVKFK
ncbi:MAG: LysR substrate-binding domain-containing protein [Nocardioides sp.]|nr:LysR substrate-binding domain-containing protein [Nocardioides sp.]